MSKSNTPEVHDAAWVARQYGASVADQERAAIVERHLGALNNELFDKHLRLIALSPNAILRQNDCAFEATRTELLRRCPPTE